MSTDGYLAWLDATENELLLYTHVSHKDRAKRLVGARWDPERRCWRYPRTASHYDAIMEEFRGALMPCSVPRPTDRSGPDANALREEVERLTARQHELEAELAAIRQERARLQAALTQRTQEADQLRQAGAQAQAEVERLTAELAARTFEAQCRELARELVPDDPEFVAASEAASLGPYTALEMCKLLEARLTTLLEPDEPLDLAKLIEQAGKGPLDRQGAQLAHTVRMLRHRVAHPDRARAERPARSGPTARPDRARAVIALLATALVCSQLPSPGRRHLRVVAS
jgi:cell division septum initiation protein DivIVA